MSSRGAAGHRAPVHPALLIICLQQQQEKQSVGLFRVRVWGQLHSMGFLCFGVCVFRPPQTFTFRTACEAGSAKQILWCLVIFQLTAFKAHLQMVLLTAGANRQPGLRNDLADFV